MYNKKKEDKKRGSIPIITMETNVNLKQNTVHFVYFGAGGFDDLS